MAKVEKHTHAKANLIFRHNAREIQNPKNTDIDPARSHLNYSFEIERGRSDYEIYKKRLSELYVYGRKDVKTLCSWVVTAPADLPQEEHKQFFIECCKFLVNRYGMKNVVQAKVHRDEATPHLHFCFIPALADKKHGGEKVCANDILTKNELRKFHPDLQKHLNAAGINAKVHTGVTAAQGGNRTIQQLKLNIQRVEHTQQQKVEVYHAREDNDGRTR